MARRKHHKTETRIVKVEEPGTGVFQHYVVFYQNFRGNMPIGEPWKAYLRKNEYDLLTMKWILISEFKVPKHFVDKVLETARDAAREDLF